MKQETIKEKIAYHKSREAWANSRIDECIKALLSETDSEKKYNINRNKDAYVGTSIMHNDKIFHYQSMLAYKKRFGEN